MDRTTMSIFEAIMMVCFGAAWPFSIYKSWISRQTAGKSLIFLFILEFGYISGIIHKILYSYNAVIYLYLLNAMFVLIDIVFYYRNRRFELSRTASN